MKKIILFLPLALVLLFTSCNGKDAKKASKDNWKIGILTGTVAQNEEEYRAAENVQAKYGKDRVVLQTYPDKFMDEQETVVGNIVGLASDPDVKALIICQAVPGTSAAIDKIKEFRDDLLIIAGTSGEDPQMIAERADIILMTDDLGVGSAMIEQAKAQGATTFVHYSFPRHMSYALLSARRDLLKENAEKHGLVFVDATSPDPTGDAGVPGTQQFILEDIPRKIEKYGKDTAFFGTNCAMQPAMIKAITDEKGIYPQPCCPSPTHGFPNALEVSIPEGKEGDFAYIIDEIKKKAAEADMTGRLSTWPIPLSMMFIEAGAEYAVNWINEGFDKLDDEQLDKAFESYLEAFGADGVQVTPLVEDGVTYPNYKMILSSYLTF